MFRIANGFWKFGFTAFFLPRLLMGKTIKAGISVVVVGRAIVKTSARKGFYSEFVWKFDF